jgi:hypothetical protein
MSGPLFRLLEKRTGSTKGAFDAISDVMSLMGSPGASTMDEQMAGLALCARGEEIENVSKCLSWRDFESLCSSVLRARGFVVKQNVMLKRPRAQIDVVAISEGFSLAIDCKHWKKSAGYSGLVGIMEAQKSRARRLRASLDGLGPVASLVLVLVDSGARFVAGGAVVPIFAFGDFLNNLESHRMNLETA